MIKIIIVLALLCGILFAVAIAVVGNHAVDAIAQQAGEPESAAEIILQSRQISPTALPITRSEFSTAGLLVLVLVAVGACLLFMRGTADLLKQWRLARKRPSRRSRQTPYVPTWVEPPSRPTVSQLPEVNHDSLPDYFD